MGRRKRHNPAAETGPTTHPFCYYCDREFEDEGVLIQHQKSKHFKCSSCGKKMTTIGSLITHHRHVHKETITKVPNAKDERDSLELQIYGMEGVPPAIVALHRSSAPFLKRRRGADFDDDDEATPAGRSVLVPAVPAPIPLAAAQFSPEMFTILASAGLVGPTGALHPFAMAAPQVQPQPISAHAAPQTSAIAPQAGTQRPPEAPAAAAGAGSAAAQAAAEKEAAAAAAAAAHQQTVAAMGGTLVYDDESLSLEESRIMRSSLYAQYLHYL